MENGKEGVWVGICGNLNVQRSAFVRTPNIQKLGHWTLICPFTVSKLVEIVRKLTKITRCRKKYRDGRNCVTDFESSFFMMDILRVNNTTYTNFSLRIY